MAEIKEVKENEAKERRIPEDRVFNCVAPDDEIRLATVKLRMKEGLSRYGAYLKYELPGLVKACQAAGFLRKDYELPDPATRKGGRVSEVEKENARLKALIKEYEAKLAQLGAAKK